MKVKNLC